MRCHKDSVQGTISCTCMHSSYMSAFHNRTKKQEWNCRNWQTSFPVPRNGSGNGLYWTLLVQSCYFGRIRTHSAGSLPFCAITGQILLASTILHGYIRRCAFFVERWFWKCFFGHLFLLSLPIWGCLRLCIARMGFCVREYSMLLRRPAPLGREDVSKVVAVLPLWVSCTS